MIVRPYLSVLAIAGALLGGTVAARAQSYPMPTAPAGASANHPGAPAADGRPHRHNRMREALQNLNLSPAQRGQIRTAFQQFRAARSSATPMTRAQLRNQIEGVLTPTQRLQFETNIRRRPVQPQTQPG